MEYIIVGKLAPLRRILRGATPIDFGLSIAVAVVITIAAWGGAGDGAAQPETVTAAVHA